MRHRKARGRKPAQVTLVESEIMEACQQYLEDKGYELHSLSRLVLNFKRKKVEVQFDYNDSSCDSKLKD